jgi:hypothetical protein
MLELAGETTQTAFPARSRPKHKTHENTVNTTVAIAEILLLPPKPNSPAAGSRHSRELASLLQGDPPRPQEPANVPNSECKIGASVYHVPQTPDDASESSGVHQQLSALLARFGSLAEQDAILG